MKLATAFDPPIEPVRHPLFNRNGISVFIKREDMIHPFISGNKWRKLKYVLDDAERNHQQHLVSFGGAYSNHLVALACAGATYGFRTTAFVRGEPVNNPMLSLCRMYGMELLFVSREAYRDKHTLYNHFASVNAHTCFIDEGGKGPLAAKGCSEMLGQINGFSHVVCAVGTGTTLAGIASSAAAKNIIAEGICVLKGAETIDHDIATLAGMPVKVHHGFHQGGYAKTNEELIMFIHAFAKETGILLDQVYTAKMMMGIAKLIDEKYYPENSRILAIHTGGLLGMMSML